jgi:hypothetical protein
MSVGWFWGSHHRDGVPPYGNIRGHMVGAVPPG